MSSSAVVFGISAFCFLDLSMCMCVVVLLTCLVFLGRALLMALLWVASCFYYSRYDAGHICKHVLLGLSTRVSLVRRNRSRMTESYVVYS